MTGEPDEEALEGVLGVMEAAMAGILVHVKPMFAAKIREVLERNESIVHQVPAALDHLTGEIVDALFAPTGEDP